MKFSHVKQHTVKQQLVERKLKRKLEKQQKKLLNTNAWKENGNGS